MAAPFVPSDPEQILERLPTRDGVAWDAIRVLHAALEASPDDASVAAALSQRYLELNRVAGDPRLVAYATRAIAHWAGIPLPPIEVALARSLIAQTEHRFDAARAELLRLVERAPRSSQAWLTLAGIDTVQGRYADAKRACSRLVLLHDAVVVGGCFAAVQVMTGEAVPAYRFLTKSLERPEHLAPGLVDWLATLAAETAEGLGLDEEAARHYGTAFGARGSQPSVYLLTAYADFLLRRGEPQTVIELLQDGPPADPLLLRLALAESRIGDADPKRVETLRYRLELALRGDDGAHAREAALFALRIENDAARALPLALGNWTVQRELIDARLVLEAAAEAGLPRAARPVLDWLANNSVEHRELASSSERLGKP